MSKNNFNKKIKFYKEIIDNIDLLTSNTETKYEVLNNIYCLIDTLGVNENLSIRKMGKQLKSMMYCEGQLNVVSSTLKNELDEIEIFRMLDFEFSQKYMEDILVKIKSMLDGLEPKYEIDDDKLHEQIRNKLDKMSDIEKQAIANRKIGIGGKKVRN